MGKKRSSGKLFYQFSLEERVPTDHLLRRVDAVVDFTFVRRLTARFYSPTGQPSVDPMVLLKMARVGYLDGIIAERRLVEEIDRPLAYRWFIGYDLDEAIPDHSILAKARRRFGPTLYQAFFTAIVHPCDQAGLIRGDKLHVDSPLVEADACLDSVSSRAVVRQLPDSGAHVADLWHDNPAETSPGAPTGGDTPPVLAVLTTRPPDGPPSPISPRGSAPVPTPAPSAGGLAGEAGAAPVARPPALHVAGKPDVPHRIEGGANRGAVSRTAPEAEMGSRWGVPLDLYDQGHVGVDAGRARIVTAVEATGGAVGDAFLLERIVREHAGNVKREWAEVVADAKDGTTANDAFVEKEGSAASIPPHATKATDRALTVDAFSDDAAHDQDRCPAGQILRRQGKSATAGARGGIS
jgi:transposase